MRLVMVEIDKCFSLAVCGEGLPESKSCVLKNVLHAQIKILPGCIP